jgi:hypothetical protein
MNKAEELIAITRKVLGDRPGKGFYSKANSLLTEGTCTNASLLSATRKIELIVKLFVGVELAVSLNRKYSDFFKNNPSYL